jgi:hypothetical protein
MEQKPKHQTLRGTTLMCNFCGKPFDVPQEQSFSDSIECSHGYACGPETEYSFLLPAIPEHEWKAIWLEPITRLTYEQLSLLKRLGGFHKLNILEIRKIYLDGKRHLLVAREPPSALAEIARLLTKAKIPFTIEDA